MLKLSFKKLVLFTNTIEALGVTYKIGGIVQVKEARAAKIRNWPTPWTTTEVRAFLGAIGMTRRWVKNFAETARPLTRLTGDVDWSWADLEQLSFEFLRTRCADTVEMHGVVYDKAVRVYIDASTYGGGCAITQMRKPITMGTAIASQSGRVIDPITQATTSQKSQESTPSILKDIEYLVLYGSFTFISTQHNYGTYKRELLAMVEFAWKYNYLLRGPAQSVVLTDHKPLTTFLDSSAMEGIYC